MRRSKSSSNIPIPKRSTARASSEERLNLLKYTTPVRGYQVTSGLSSGSGRLPSTSRRPPSTTSKRVPSSATLSKDRKSIQALISDRRWVDQQYDKVRIFIEESTLFPDKSISSTLKPLSLKSFVYIMNILLGEIFSKIEITSDNYKEIIQQKYKVLRYPGTISISTLKCVNVPHAFPQVIAMIGWLVDKVSLQLNVKNSQMDYLPMVMKSKTSQITFNYFMKKYVKYNEAPDTDMREIDKEYVENIKKALNIDENILKEHENKIRKNKKIIKDQEKEIQALENSNSELTRKTQVLEDEITQFEKTEPSEEMLLTREIDHLKHCIKMTDVMCNKKQEKIQDLQETIKKQPYSQKDKSELLKKIDNLNERIEMEKEKIEQLCKLKEEFISKHDLEKEKVKIAVKQWNNRLLKWTIYKPELEQFLLEEGMLEEDSFFDRVKQVQEEKEIVDKQLIYEKKKIDSLLSKQFKQGQELKSEISSTEAMLKELEDKLKSLETVNATLSMNIKKNDEESKMTKENLIREISRLKQECAELEENNNRISMEIKEQINKLKATMVKAVCFFTELYTEIKSTWVQVSKIQNDTTVKLLEKRDSMQGMILEVLNQLENDYQGIA